MTDSTQNANSSRSKDRAKSRVVSVLALSSQSHQFAIFVNSRSCAQEGWEQRLSCARTSLKFQGEVTSQNVVDNRNTKIPGN